MDYCIENDIIDEVEEKPTAETGNVLKLKLEFGCKERRLVYEEAQRVCEAAQADRSAEKALQDAQFAEAQKARELRLAELREARELHELELKN